MYIVRLSYRVIDIQTDGSYVLTCVLTTTNNNVNRQIQQVDIIVHGEKIKGYYA